MFSAKHIAPGEHISVTVNSIKLIVLVSVNIKSNCYIKFNYVMLSLIILYLI